MPNIHKPTRWRRIRCANGSHGKLVNRPLDEIIAQCPPANDQLGYDLPHDRTRRRYARNEANGYMGYCDGEIAIWLARLDATTHAEVVFAWRSELILARMVNKMRAIK